MYSYKPHSHSQHSSPNPPPHSLHPPSHSAPHKRGASITFADLDYDDRIKTISRRKQGQIAILLGKYQLKEKVGKGAFGIVHKALEFETGKYVAIKRLKKEYIDEKMLLQLQAEVELLKALDHPHIVKYIGLMESDNHINMILEFIESGSLLQIIQKYGVLPEPLASNYTGQVLEGLNYLHNKNVIHRDIKASNILITAEGMVKLADFGIATTSTDSIDQGHDNSAFAEGSPFWMSPEVIQLEPPTTACDIWSLGCTIIELVTGSPPYFDMPAMSALFKIVQDDCPPIPGSFTEALKEFLMLCFQKEHQLRPTAADLANHYWVKQNIFPKMDLMGAQSTIRMHNMGGVGFGGGGDKWGNDSDSGGSGRGSMRGRAALSSIDWGDSSDRDSSGSDLSDGSVGRKSTIPKRVREVAKSFEDFNHKESAKSYLVLITGYEIRKNKLFSYTVFRLKVCFGKESWRVYKTYTDFKELHVLVTNWTRNYSRGNKRNVIAKPKLPKFPGAKMFGADKASFVKKRKTSLQDYINGLIGIAEVMKAGIITNFLRSDGKDAVSRERQGSESADEGSDGAVGGTTSPGGKGSLRRSASTRNRSAVTKVEGSMGSLPDWLVDSKDVSL